MSDSGWRVALGALVGLATATAAQGTLVVTNHSFEDPADASTGISPAVGWSGVPGRYALDNGTWASPFPDGDQGYHLDNDVPSPPEAPPTDIWQYVGQSSLPDITLTVAFSDRVPAASALDPTPEYILSIWQGHHQFGLDVPPEDFPLATANGTIPNNDAWSDYSVTALGVAPGTFIYVRIQAPLEADKDDGLRDYFAVDNVRITEFADGLPGDFNNDEDVNAADIDMLCQAIRNGGPANPYDLDGDTSVDMDDLDEMLLSILGTDYGDTDTDGDVDLSDLGNLATNYEQAPPRGWGQGDFDCDTDVDLSDLGTLATFYETGQAQAYAEFSALTGVEVPEPSTISVFGLAAWALAVRRSR